MTCLVDWEIEKQIFDGDLIINPLNTGLINPNSLDIRLGDKYGFIRSQDGLINPSDPTTFETDYCTFNEYILTPGEFCLVSMLEHITLPSTLCAKIVGKSSLGRLGLLNSSHAAGWVDASWSGVLTMELSNVGPYPIKLTKGMKIGQMVFFKTQYPKCDYAMVGRYQNQEAGQGSLGIE